MGILDTLRGGGREPSRATLALRGLLTVLTLVLVVGLLVLVGQGTFSEKLGASVVLDDAGGSLVVGSDVKYDGVVIGRVASLGEHSTGRAVEVRLDLDDETAADVPGNVVARVLPASVFGTSFLDLDLHERPHGRLRAGQQIAQDTSRETLEVQRLLDGIDDVVDSLGPAELATALEGVANALDGNGERMGRTIDRVHTYLRRLNPQLPLVRRNLELLATNLDAFQRYAPDLFMAAEDALVAANTLGRRQRDFRALVRSGSRTLDDTTSLLRTNQEQLAAALVRTSVVVDALYDGRSDIAQGVRALFELSQRLAAAMSSGIWVNVEGRLLLRREAEYRRQDCPTFSGVRGRGC